MIQMQSVLDVADNSGAKKVMCIKVLGGSKRMIAHLGDVIVVSVKSATPNAKIKQGEVHRALIVRTRTGVRRPDGNDVKFDNNSVVLLSKQHDLLGSRVFGTVPRELRGHGFTRVVSLAEGVI